MSRVRRTLAALALVGWGLAGLGPSSYAQPDQRVANTVAVEAFRNVSGGADDAWIGHGIAETVAADLGGQVGRGRDARWVVRGAYQRLGDRVRVTAELVNGVSGRRVDSVKIDGSVADLFGLQDALAAAIATRLSAQTDSAGTAPSAGAGGLGGFALSEFAIIDGPLPPLPPEVVTRDAAGRMTMRALRLETAIMLDGRLDERVYHDVPGVTGFVQQEPDEGAPATDQTEIWVLFDDDTLYVTARCWSEEPDRLVANEMKQDASGMFGNETFAVVLDTFYDRRNGFNFITNPLGGLFDATVTNERTPNVDWNTVWDVKTGRFDGGWSVEMAIPFKSLRFRAGEGQIWGILAQRRAASKNEISYLTPIPAALAFAGLFKLSSAATLVGVEVPPAGPRLELKPYAIADATTDFTTPGASSAAGGDIGFDAKVGVTQGLTADLTYNTDFAQVEVDEQQVNLTRFSLFFPEKREFFLEGQGIFEFGGGYRSGPTAFFFRGERFGGGTAPVLFFSRRIGLEDSDPVPIRGGGRLTGKAGAYSIGLLNVQTGDEPGLAAVGTNFAVARVKRDVLRRSAIGALATRRSVAVDGAGASGTYGVDGLFSFYDNLNVNTYLARTQTPGVRGDDLSYQTQVDYNGDEWGVVAERLAVGANFNPEIGFVRRADFRRNFGSFRYSPRPASIGWIRKLLFEASLDYTTDGADRLETRIGQGLFRVDLENGDRFFAGSTDTYERLREPFDIDSDLSIPVGIYTFVNTRVVYALGQQRPWSGAFTFDRGGFFGGRRTSVGFFNGRLGITPQLTIEPSVSLNWIELPQDSFTTELIGARTTYTVTPRMFVAALLQFSSGGDSLSTNVRFRWEYLPGSELFVVYTDERDTLTPRFPTLENRAFVIKLTRLFRF